MANKKKKTAGVWNKDERGVYFIAGAPTRQVVYKSDEVSYQDFLIAINELNDPLVEIIEATLDEVNWFIDSGVYSLAMEHARRFNVSHDNALNLPPHEVWGYDTLFGKYVDYLGQFGNKIWGYIEIDFGGKDWKTKTREELEGMGLRPIPVYHPFADGWDYFDFLAEQYDRICFGNIVHAEAPVRKRLLATAWERKRKYPDLWIHFLGMSPNELISAYPADSFDSSSWLAVVRWNGFMSKAMMKNVGFMSKEYQHRLGGGDRANYDKALMMSAYSMKLEMEMMRKMWGKMEEAGFDFYPEVVE
jgi:hypothetical protein